MATRGGRQTKPELLSFEKDLSYELACLRKLSNNREEHTMRQRLSSGLFQLWNKYEKRLAHEFLAEKLLSTGDSLYQAKEYQLASVHCYGRYLASLRKDEAVKGRGGCCWIVDYCLKSTLITGATLALRAAIGDVASRHYHYLIENEDPYFTRQSTQSHALCTLRDLQFCSQASLQREAHYWLTYNCLLLSYSICRKMMVGGVTDKAVAPLLWASVCMESSVPLLAVKFLRLRVDIYTSVCQCYYHMREPYQAELFARRGLDRVHELAVLVNQSSSRSTEASERLFREATLKLGVIVFRRSVLESRLTKKGVFRPKKRPSIRELLQQSFPRSPTEKLLSELFTGEAAQFMAVMEALAEPHRSSLEKGLPHPITSLDADTTSDVIQELLCWGTDLALWSLQHWEDEEETHTTTTLLEAATDGSDLIPLASILSYVRMAVSYDQHEVVELLLDRATALAVETDSDPAVHRQRVSIRVLLLVEAVRGTNSRRVTLPQSQHPLPQEPGEKLVQLSTVLHSACNDHTLLEWERDLLQDSILFLWEAIRPAFSRLYSHHPHTTHTLTTSQRGRECAGVLGQLVDMAECLQLWRPHPLLCGELILKLSCLTESSASSRPHRAEGHEVRYDRGRLLEAKDHLERGVGWVWLSRTEDGGEIEGGAAGQSGLVGSGEMEGGAAGRSRLAGSGEMEGGVAGQSGLVGSGEMEGGAAGRSRLAGSGEMEGGTAGQRGLVGSEEMEGGTAGQCGLVGSEEMEGGTAGQSGLVGSEEMEGGTAGQSGLALVHSELLYALTRVRVKLTATVPPPATPDPTLKPSSLLTKVQGKREKAEQRRALLASLSAHDAPVQPLSQLRAECGSSHYHTALLAMLEAVFTPTLSHSRRTALAQEAASHLQQLNKEESLPLPSSPVTPSTITPSPPPPSLIHRTHTTMTFIPAPWHPPSGQQVVYYSLYGRLAEGSNVKVRLSDKAYPGLGTQVPAGPNCVLKVKGLRPNAAYVFAVAAYDREGQVLGQQTGQLLGRSSLQMGQPTGGSIGETGRPIVASHPLPVLIAWGYCCQCAYTAGVKDVALKAANVLWTHFIETSTRHSQETTEYRLKPAVVTSSHPSLLYHFIYSVFIHTQLSSPPLLSHPHTHTPPLSLPRSTQLCRLDLCHRLLQATVVGGRIEEPSLCLQTVVMCYGLLAPLLQRDIATPAIAKILLHCQCVLSEVPDHLLSHSHPSTQSALHHMIATSAFHLNKMLLKWRVTSLFSSLSENARGLLLLSMPATPLATLCARNPETALDQSVNSQAPSLTSYATASSGLFPGLLAPRGTAGQKRNRRKKKTAHLTDTLSEETKSREYKAFEAFIAANCTTLAVPPQLDTSDITGQEDPLLLHVVIATMPAKHAYKEVHKFRRRPQYLEYFVHLATAGMEQGQHHLVLEWAHETFTWLARRNEIILTSRPVHIGPKPHTTSRHAKHPRPSSHPPTSLTTTTTTATTRAASNAHSTKTPSALGESMNSHGGKPHPPEKTTPTPCKPHPPNKAPPAPCKAVVRHSGGGSVLPAGKTSRRSIKLRSSLLNETLTRLLALEGVVVTREDLELKATSVLQTLLPEVWRQHKCRKRIREVCSDELAWRSQANVCLAQCYLNQLLTHRSAGREEEEEEGGGYLAGLEGGGVMLGGAIPTYPPVTPGYSHKERENQNPHFQGEPEKTAGPPSAPLTPLQQLGELMRCLQCAVVLAHRGRLWVLLQNTCRELWNAINCLITSVPSSAQQSEDCTINVDCVCVAAVYGLASKPLYMAVEAITDLLTAYTTPGHTLHSQPDSAVEPDCNFLRRFSLLAVLTMSAQQHWERLVSVGMRLCEGMVRGGGGEEGTMGREWVSELVPVILEAQSRLVKRVAEHGADMKRDVLDPAAHLDPGPAGHDIYGPTGQALARVCVPLDPQTVLGNLKIEWPVKNGATHILKRCRNLLASYLNGSASTDACIASSQLPLLINSYNEAICQLKDISEACVRELTASARELTASARELTASAMSDLGNLYFMAHNNKLAGHWWEQALCQLLGCQSSQLRTWRGKRRKLQSNCGHPATMLAAVLATKLARYTYSSRMDVSLQYLLSAAALFKSIPASSLPHSPSDLSFLTPSHPHISIPGTTGTPSCFPIGTNLFGDPLISDPVTSLEALQYCAGELVERKQIIMAFPVIWLYWYTAHTECRSARHTLLAHITRLEALTQIHCYSVAVGLLGEILAGSGLPQTVCQYDHHTENHATLKFNDTLPIYDPTNVKVLKLLMGRDLPSSVASLCGLEAMVRLAVARANLYTALASSCTTLAPLHILTRPTNLTSPPTHLLPPSPAPITSPQSDPIPASSSSSSLPPSSSKPSRAMSWRTTDPRHIKTLLVEQTEQILQGAWHSLSSLPSSSPTTELRVLILLSLSRLSLCLHHKPTATQLSLAALRVLQSTSAGPTRSAGHRLWTQCWLNLAEGLVGRGRRVNGVTCKIGGDVMDCGLKCEEGVKEAQKCGDFESKAAFHFIAALHALSSSPPKTKTILAHTQQCLQILNSLPSPSPSSSLIHAHCTLLLCDTGHREGHVTSCDAAHIYQRLVEKLRKQISGSESPPCSAYHPIRPLLASTLFRLSLLCGGPHEGPCEDPHGHESPGGHKRDHCEETAESLSLCGEALELLEATVLMDSCLKCSLLRHRVLLLQKMPSIQRSEVTNELLVTIGNIADTKVDYSEQFVCCFEVAWLLSEAIEERVVTSLPQAVKSKSSRSSSCVPTKAASRGEDIVRVKSMPDVKKKVVYTAWCALKTAQQALHARDNFQNLATQLHNPDLAKPIPQKTLADLPEFALLELCGSDHSLLTGLLTSSDIPSIDLLVPSGQTVLPATLTWCHVVAHTYAVLVRLFWPTDLSPLPRTHTLTSSLHTQFTALATFLNKHCPSFSASCSLPALPPSLLPSHNSPAGTATQGGSGGGPIAAPLHHLRASDNELTVVWYKPPANCQLLQYIASVRPKLSSVHVVGEQDSNCPVNPDGKSVDTETTPTGTASRDLSGDIILGVFGFNQRAVKSTSTTCPAVEVFTVRSSTSHLTQLQETWEELSVAAQGYLDGHLSGRPVSRSPSRLRKQAEKTQRVHAGLQAKLMEGVERLSTTLGRRAYENRDLPRLEPHVLGGVSSLLPPPTLPTSITVQGDTFHFIHALFHSTRAMM